MGESQSRYSIVERLTNKKLSIIDEGTNLDKVIEDTKQLLNERESQLKVWKTSELAELASEESRKDNVINSLKNKITFLTNSKTEKLRTLDLKSDEIDKALEKLQTISEVANVVNNSN